MTIGTPIEALENQILNIEANVENLEERVDSIEEKLLSIEEKINKIGDDTIVINSTVADIRTMLNRLMNGLRNLSYY